MKVRRFADRDWELWQRRKEVSAEGGPIEQILEESEGRRQQTETQSFNDITLTLKLKQPSGKCVRLQKQTVFGSNYIEHERILNEQRYG